MSDLNFITLSNKSPAVIDSVINGRSAAYLLAPRARISQSAGFIKRFNNLPTALRGETIKKE